MQGVWSHILRQVLIMKIVMVGEAWGKSEHQFQHPLVGASGRELTLQLGISGLGPFMTLLCRKCKRETRFLESRCEFCSEYIWPNEFNLIEYWKQLRQVHSIHVTNVFNARPPDNNIGLFFGKEKETDLPPCKIPKNTNGSHVLAEHYHHVKRLWRELEDLKPNLVVTMGNVPSWALLGETRIMSLRGTVNWSDRLGLKVLPTVHPAGVMRQWPIRPTVIQDLRKAKIESEFPEIRRPKRWITIPSPNEDGLREIRQWLDTSGRRALKNDIETVRKQISIIGFSRSADEALVIPFRDCHSKNGKIVDVGQIAASIGFPNNGVNFWPNADLEFRAWKLAIEPIESPEIELTFQNGLYDMSYYLKMGIQPRRAEHDSMLWHHSQYPELPKSLGFLGSVYANDVAWKTMNRSSDSLKRDE